MQILGIMSGSSLDGIDMALCRISGFGDKLKIGFEKTKKIAFTEEWKSKLKELPYESAKALHIADFEFGYLIGDVCTGFLDGSHVDLIASHGHTIFHYPEIGTTCQIGHGAAIASRTGFPVICDFRSGDIASGGQGAPLVSVLDQHIFSDFELLLNLGGIANITYNDPENPIAFDVGPCNQLLNFLSGKMGKEYDTSGDMAASGELIPDLLQELLTLEYFQLAYPKSMDNSFVAETYFPIFETHPGSFTDKLRTAVEFIAISIGDAVNKSPFKNTGSPSLLMVTGGGVHNGFLMERIKIQIKETRLKIPDNQLVDFKEAMLMSYLGYLRIKGKENTLSSVTGAEKDTIGGAIYLP